MPKFNQRCSHWRCGRCSIENRGHKGNTCSNCSAPKSIGTSLERRDGDWKCRSCSYINFRRRGTCNGCTKPKNWVPESEEEKKERERKGAEEREEARLKEEEKERKTREKAKELGLPDGWKWEDLTDDQLFELI